MPDYSLADIAAATGNGNNNGGFGDGNSGWWLLILFALLGGFGNNRGFGNGGGYGAGGVGGKEIYPWLNQAQLTNGGFRDQMINDTINATHQSVNDLSTQLCNCCSDMQMALANGLAGVNNNLCNGFNSVNLGMLQGFNGVEQSANARQVADMQQAFNSQLATQQGFNGVQGQLAQQTATILAENCADRSALSDGVRDIIANQTAMTQRQIDNQNAGNRAILDKLCQLELDGVKNQLAQAERENVGLQNQLNMANLAASQAAQNQLITQGFSNEVDALYNRLSSCPVPTTPVYGRTPIFTCNNNGCGCGCN